MQNDSFFLFSRPTTYFGSYQNIGEEFDSEDWDFMDSWSISLDAYSSIHLKQEIGLYIHWPDDI